MLCSGVETPFVELLRKLIDEGRFRSRRDFARVAEGEDSEEAAHRYLTKVLNDGRPPMFERVEAWADALELYGDERQQFLDLAAIAHLPVEAQPRFLALLRQFEAAKADLHTRDELIKTLRTEAQVRNALLHGVQVRIEQLDRAGQGVRKDV